MMIDEEARYKDLPMDEPTLELKTLPSTLKYAFLDEEKAKLVIISSKLNMKQEEQLLEVLGKNKEAIGWPLTDLKGLDPSLCTHRIFLEDESRPVREAQRHIWRDGTARSSISHGLVSKIFLNLPIWWKCLELKGIMVNKGRIQRKKRKFLMYFLWNWSNQTMNWW